MDEADSRLAVAQACRVLAFAGLAEDVLGHVSVRAGSDALLVRCRGPQERGLLFTTPDDIHLVGLDGPRELPGGYRVPSELPIHVETLRSRPAVNAVVHAHPPAVVTADLAGLRLRPVVGAYNIPAMALARDGIAVYPRGVLVSRADLAAEMLAAMGGAAVCVLRGHGVTTTGATMAQAVIRALSAESLAKVVLGAAQAGGHPADLPDADVAELPDLGSALNEESVWRYHLSALEHAGLGPVMDLAAILASVRGGMVPAHVYNDAEIFALERDRLFARAWVFVAHESEIPAPGDYVVRRVLADSFIVARDEAGTVRVMFNMCLHKGMQVCRAELGNASHFRCPYHAWTYRNDGTLAGVPFHGEAYGGEDGFARTGQSLLPAPAMDSYNGMIFISLDADAPALREWLGDFAFYLDLYTRQTPAGIELRGPQRWRVKANWKIGAENFAGDSYHTPHTHASVVDIGLFREPKASKRKEGALYVAGPGAGTTYKLPPGGSFADQLRYVGYPPDMIAVIEETWSPGQRALVAPDGFMVSAATLFPNLSFVHNWPQIDEAGTVAPFISLRQWQPVSERETEILSWFAVDASASPEFKRASYQAYLMCFGSSGMFEQDDVENWVSITDMAGGSMARRLLLNSAMGLTSAGLPIKPPMTAFSGPGVAYQGFGEFNQRHWLAQWSDHLEAP